MNAKINIPHILRQYTNNQGVVEVNGNTVGQCLNHLIKQFPGIKQEIFDNNGKLHDYIDVYVNGESSYLEELAKPVKPGAELYILFVIDGG